MMKRMNKMGGQAAMMRQMQAMQGQMQGGPKGGRRPY
jgi:hypothetical protein